MRHGTSYPLPDDDSYKLNLIIYEAHFYKLPELAKSAERARFYARLKYTPSKSLPTKLHSTLENPKRQSAAGPVLSMRKYAAVCFHNRGLLPFRVGRILVHFPALKIFTEGKAELAKMFVLFFWMNHSRCCFSKGKKGLECTNDF